MSPSGQEGYFLPPREDINSPDMYIPGKGHLHDDGKSNI